MESQDAKTVEELKTISRERRNLILSEINELTSEAPAFSDKVHQLRQEYNNMLDEWVNISRESLSDPLQALPPELWGEFLPKTTTELLILTLVSTSWKQILTSVPLLWTTIALDPIEGDYLAKAVVGLHLSQPLTIDLRIELSFTMWKNIAPIFIAEGSRIRKLRILPTRGDRLEEALAILASFKDLPALKILVLPLPQNVPQRYVNCDPRIVDRFPSLTSAASIPLPAKMLTLPNFKNLRYIRIHSFDQEMAEAIRELQDLNILSLDCGVKRIPQSGASKFKRLGFLFPSVTELYYTDGPFSKGHQQLNPTFRSILQCMSQNLYKIMVKPVNIHAIPDLFTELQQFQRLRIIQLDIDQSPEDRDAISMQMHTPLLTVQEISLTFTFPTYIFRTINRNYNEDERSREKSFAQMFHSLITIIPHVEVLWLVGWFMPDIALDYIRHLSHLRSLTVVPTAPSLLAPKSAFTLKARSMKYILPADFLDRVQCSSLRFLQTTTAVYTYIDTLHEQGGDIKLTSSRYAISSTVLDSVKTLSLSAEFPPLVDLVNLPTLRTLTLYGTCVTLASDFLEELVLQPHSLPSLESIRFLGHFVEWDILILMLERRNFLPGSGIKRISSLTVNGEIPYKLVHPIAHLLGGKFVDRSPISDYSITEIGNHLWDPKVTGCHGCLRRFFPCNSPVQSVQPHRGGVDSELLYKGDSRLAWDYQLPHERLQSSPPLSPEIYQWLVGKRERRIRFVERSKAARINLLFRPVMCTASERMPKTVSVARHSFDGLTFED